MDSLRAHLEALERPHVIAHGKACLRRADSTISALRESGRLTGERIAALIRNEEACTALSLSMVERMVLVLPACILFAEQRREYGASKENGTCEVELMEWSRRAWTAITPPCVLLAPESSLRDMQVAFAISGETKRFIDLLALSSELRTDLTSEAACWGVKNSPFTGSLYLLWHVRKWACGWKRFLPWIPSKPLLNPKIGTRLRGLIPDLCFCWGLALGVFGLMFIARLTEPVC